MEQFKRVFGHLSGALGQEYVKRDTDVIDGYAVDHVVPKAVVFPKDAQEVSEAVRCARSESLCIVPWGSGSKMNAGHPPRHVDLVVCTSRMNRMIDVDTANLTMTAEAGVKFRDIQARLSSTENRCYLPLEDLTPEPGATICSERSDTPCFLPIDAPFCESATIGGIVASNSSGPRRLLYGLPRDLVLGMRFVAPNGDIIKTGGKTVKNVSGYDISKLMIGSFGSLGILCEITMRLLPLPEKMETVLVSFGSISDARDFTDRLFETRLLPAAVEFLNHTAFAHLRTEEIPDTGPEECLLAIALEAFDRAVDRMRVEIRDLAKAAGSVHAVILTEDRHRRFWLAVSRLLPSLAQRFSGLVTIQLNYPVSAWHEMVPFARHTLSSLGLEHSILACVGSGCCLIALLMDRNEAERTGKAFEAVNMMSNRCLEATGNLAVLMAPTEFKEKLPVWGRIRPDLVVMKRIKEQLDPSGIMSPGRFFGGI
jgi:glycolate oxidase FAD binding subunit